MFKQILKNLIEWGIVTFLALILILVISPLLPFKNMPKIFVITSGSMEPTILTGSIVMTSSINPEHVKVKDVVAFQNPADGNSVILHRIIEVKKTDILRFRTKGDNNKVADNWEINGSAVLGKLWFSVPYIGYLAMFIRKPLGFGIVIVIPALFFIILQIVQIKNAINEEVEKKVKEKLGEKNTRDSITKLMALFMTIGLTLYLGSIHTAKAVFKSSVTLSNFKLEAIKEVEKCEKDDDDDDDDHDKKKDKKDKDKDNDKDKKHDKSDCEEDEHEREHEHQEEKDDHDDDEHERKESRDKEYKKDDRKDLDDEKSENELDRDEAKESTESENHNHE